MIDAEFARAEAEVRPERRVILVDGFNVLHAVLLGKERDDGWWRREPRERLLRRIAGWPEGADEIWVAFDGTSPAWSVWAEPITRVGATPSTAISSPNTEFALPEPPLPKATIHSVYVESADDWIVRRARRAGDPTRTIVVSGDRKVAGRARSAGCEVWTPWGFVARCPEVGGGLAGGSREVLEAVPETVGAKAIALTDSPGRRSGSADRCS